MYNTFNGWKLRGRVVEYGSISHIRNEYGDKMFHVSQTVPRGGYNVYLSRRPSIRGFHPSY